MVNSIKLKDGRKFDSDIVLIQAGIRPIIDLAKNANIKTDRGIIINEFLETSEKDIYAVGDCVQFKDQIWGIIPACIEQSKIVAASVLELKKVKYEGTTPKNTLKIVGLELTSIGIIDPIKEEGTGWEILKKSDKKDCCYQKIVLKDNKLKGAILYKMWIRKNSESCLNYIFTSALTAAQNTTNLKWMFFLKICQKTGDVQTVKTQKKGLKRNRPLRVRKCQFIDVENAIFYM
jgi:hypothetical protein